MAGHAQLKFVMAECSKTLQSMNIFLSRLSLFMFNGVIQLSMAKIIAFYFQQIVGLIK